MAQKSLIVEDCEGRRVAGPYICELAKCPHPVSRELDHLPRGEGF